MSLSRNPDVDREILIRLNHVEIFNLCVYPVNKYFKRICNDIFYRKLLEKKCCYLLHHKPENISYKKYYIDTVKNVINFLEKLGFVYANRCIFEMFNVELDRPYFLYSPLCRINSRRYFKDTEQYVEEFLEMIEVSENIHMKKIFDNIFTTRNDIIITMNSLIKIKMVYDKINRIGNCAKFFDIIDLFIDEFVPLSELTSQDFLMVQCYYLICMAENFDNMLDKISSTI